MNLSSLSMSKIRLIVRVAVVIAGAVLTIIHVIPGWSGISALVPIEGLIQRLLRDIPTSLTDPDPTQTSNSAGDDDEGTYLSAGI